MKVLMTLLGGALLTLTPTAPRLYGQTRGVESGPIAGAPVAFQAFAIDTDGSRRAIGSGTVEFRLGQELDIMRDPPDGLPWTRKTELFDGFVLAVNFREQISPSVARPALAVSLTNVNLPGSLSHFQAIRSEADGVFAGRGGRLLVSGSPDGGVTLEFPDDYVLELREDIRSNVVSHEIVVRAGSRIELVHGTDRGPLATAALVQ